MNGDRFDEFDFAKSVTVRAGANRHGIDKLENRESVTVLNFANRHEMAKLEIDKTVTVLRDGVSSGNRQIGKCGIRHGSARS